MAQISSRSGGFQAWEAAARTGEREQMRHSDARPGAQVGIDRQRHGQAGHKGSEASDGESMRVDRAPGGS
eukprot:2337100-Prymnesium_polylepis.1